MKSRSTTTSPNWICTTQSTTLGPAKTKQTMTGRSKLLIRKIIVIQRTRNSRVDPIAILTLTTNKPLHLTVKTKTIWASAIWGRKITRLSTKIWELALEKPNRVSEITTTRRRKTTTIIRRRLIVMEKTKRKQHSKTKILKQPAIKRLTSTNQQGQP